MDVHPVRSVNYQLSQVKDFFKNFLYAAPINNNENGTGDDSLDSTGGGGRGRNGK